LSGFATETGCGAGGGAASELPKSPQSCEKSLLLPPPLAAFSWGLDCTAPSVATVLATGSSEVAVVAGTGVAGGSDDEGNVNVGARTTPAPVPADTPSDTLLDVAELQAAHSCCWTLLSCTGAAAAGGPEVDFPSGIFISWKFPAAGEVVGHRGV